MALQGWDGLCNLGLGLALEGQGPRHLHHITKRFLALFSLFHDECA